MRIAIIGAGLAGLTLARLLKDSSHEVQIFEQAAALEEIGAGVQIGPNGVRVLRAAGLDPVQDGIGILVNSVSGRNWDTNEVVSDQQFLDESGKPVYGEPFVHCHRAALQLGLAAGLPEGTVLLGRRAMEVIDGADGAEVRFADGSTERADVVVGADGIHSAARGAVVEVATAPRFTKMAVFRGVVPRDALAGLPMDEWVGVGTKWWGPVPSHHAVIYLLGDGSMNFVGVVPQSSWEEESWHFEGDLSELRESFRDFPEPIPSLLGRMPRTLKWALFDRDVLDSWTSRHVVLIGDACHAMVPFMGQGACQAFEDAAILARLLRTITNQSELPGAFQRYEDVRGPRVRMIHENSRQNRFHSERSTIDNTWVYSFDALSAEL
jgi:2-polyprenyl-6-methoxyphenol hydroxylase-like FAD-dependent oxidoreductase